jgi:hypothetical protein
LGGEGEVLCDQKQCRKREAANPWASWLQASQPSQPRPAKMEAQGKANPTIVARLGLDHSSGDAVDQVHYGCRVFPRPPCRAAQLSTAGNTVMLARALTAPSLRPIRLLCTTAQGPRIFRPKSAQSGPALGSPCRSLLGGCRLDEALAKRPSSEVRPDQGPCSGSLRTVSTVSRHVKTPEIPGLDCCSFLNHLRPKNRPAHWTARPLSTHPHATLGKRETIQRTSAKCRNMALPKTKTLRPPSTERIHVGRRGIDWRTCQPGNGRKGRSEGSARREHWLRLRAFASG